jgi:hypothetical protein
MKRQRQAPITDVMSITSVDWSGSEQPFEPRTVVYVSRDHGQHWEDPPASWARRRPKTPKLGPVT